MINDGDVIDQIGDEKVKGRRKRSNAINDPNRLWPNGIVPYVMDGHFSTPQYGAMFGGIFTGRTFGDGSNSSVPWLLHRPPDEVCCSMS